jgi:hypothetical protein
VHPILPILLWHIGRAQHGLPSTPMPPDFPAHVASYLGGGFGGPHPLPPVPMPVVRPGVPGGGIVGPPMPPSVNLAPHPMPPVPYPTFGPHPVPPSINPAPAQAGLAAALAGYLPARANPQFGRAL